VLRERKDAEELTKMNEGIAKGREAGEERIRKAARKALSRGAKKGRF
jgi:hypothetical protein